MKQPNIFRSESWATISAQAKARLLPKVEDDGEFWIDFKEFSATFENISIVTLEDDGTRDGSGKCYIVESPPRQLLGMDFCPGQP